MEVGARPITLLGRASTGCPEEVEMNFGFPEVLLVLVIALLVFGPAKIPELGKALGSSIREFRAGLRSGTEAGKPEEPRAHRP